MFTQHPEKVRNVTTIINDDQFAFPRSPETFAIVYHRAERQTEKPDVQPAWRAVVNTFDNQVVRFGITFEAS